MTQERHLPVSLKLCYAAPNIAMAMLWTPLNVMQGIYIEHYGFSMGLMAVVLFASRVYDAVADILVGLISDWWKRTTGGRKPLFAIGAALFGLTAVFVYDPPRNVGPVYLTGWLFAFFTGYATIMISHLAWGADLARSSQQKTSLFGLRIGAGYTGLCLFYSMPLLPVFQSARITPETIKWSVYIAVGILIPTLILSLRFVPKGADAQVCEPHSVRLGATVRTVVSDRGFLMLMAAYVLCGGGLGIWYGMIFIFVDIYLRHGALFAPLYLLAFAVGAVSSLVWSRVAAKTGKKAAWSAGTALALLAAVATWELGPENANAWSIGTLLVLNSMGLVCFEIIPGSILGDVVDHSLLRRRVNLAGTYFSLYMFLTKVLFAMGSAVGLGLAAWVGFDPHAREQLPGGVRALHLVMTYLPTTLLALGIGLIQLIPMNERRHAVIRKRLDQREARLARATVADTPGDQTKNKGNVLCSDVSGMRAQS